MNDGLLFHIVQLSDVKFIEMMQWILNSMYWRKPSGDKSTREISADVKMRLCGWFAAFLYVYVYVFICRIYI